MKKIIWKSYKDDEIYFKNKNEEGLSNNQFEGPKETSMESTTWRKRTLRFSFEEINMPDAGEYMGLYSIGAYDRLNSWLYGGVTFTVPRLGAAEVSLLVVIPWEWNVS